MEVNDGADRSTLKSSYIHSEGWSINVQDPWQFMHACVGAAQHDTKRRGCDDIRRVAAVTHGAAPLCVLRLFVP